MASWIVHLRIAGNLLDRLPGLDPAPFLVGSIAPDSGIPDEKWETFDPPTHVTHFGTTGDQPHDLADLDFLRAHLLPLREDDPHGFFPFRLGYFFHLVTDNLWSREIGRPTGERFREQFAADKDFIWEVKKDWYGLDFIYLRENPQRPFWKAFLQALPTTGGLDFLPLEAVRGRVEYIREYYQRTDEKVQSLYNRPYRYLTQAEMDRFVEETSGRLERIYEQVWTGNLPTEDRRSALDLVPQEKKDVRKT